MLQNPAKSMSILWATWEKRVVVSGGGDGTEYALQCLRLKVCVRVYIKVCVCMDEAGRQLDGCSVTRSHCCRGAASHGQCMALASVSQKKKLNVLALSKQMLNAISR